MNGQCSCGYRPGRISPIDCRCVTHRELNERLRKIDPNEGYYQKEIDELKANKQDKLIAGTNITIEGSMISADLDSTNFYNKTETDELLTGKQNTLTAGENIVISEDNVISTDAHMLVTLTPTGAPVGGVTDYTWISEYTYAELVASLDKVAFKTTESGSENILVPTELYEALESGQNVIFGMIPSNDATVPKITNIELIVRPDGTAKTAETTALISGATYTAGDNIEISPTNEISAIIPNVYGFDIVADMKASTELKDGDFAKTTGFYAKNDGGSAFYKVREKGTSETPDERFVMAIGSDLVGELITGELVNVLQVGGENNFSGVCNDLLSAGRSIYIPKGNYTATDTITVSQDRTILKCDGNITFSGSNSTLFSIKRHYHAVEFNGDLNAGSTNNAISIGDGNGSYNVNLSVNTISSSKNGIVMNPGNTDGVQYLKCNFMQIRSSEHGIYIVPGDTGTNWANANSFSGGEIRAPIGIYARPGAEQTDAFNDNSFDRIGLLCEEVGIDLKMFTRSWFTRLRMSEGHSGTYWVKLDGCHSLTIENEMGLELAKIYTVNSPGNFYNIFKAYMIVDSEGYFLTNKIVTYRDKFIASDEIMTDPRRSHISMYNTTVFPDVEVYKNNMCVSIGYDDVTTPDTATFTLPVTMGIRGIKEFYLRLIRKPVNYEFKIEDAAGNKVATFPTGTLLSNKSYHCVLSSQGNVTSVPFWKVEELNLVS